MNYRIEPNLVSFNIPETDKTIILDPENILAAELNDNTIIYRQFKPIILIYTNKNHLHIELPGLKINYSFELNERIKYIAENIINILNNAKINYIKTYITLTDDIKKHFTFTFNNITVIGDICNIKNAYHITNTPTIEKLEIFFGLIDEYVGVLDCSICIGDKTITNHNDDIFDKEYRNKLRTTVEFINDLNKLYNKQSTFSLFDILVEYELTKN